MAEPADRTTSPPPAAPTSFTVSPSLSPFQVPLKTYLKTHPDFDGIAASALVFNPAGKLLLVQRAAHDSMPSRWEVPGGACDYEDESLLHAVARELWEESGLKAIGISVWVGGEVVFFTRRQLRMCKLSFLVEVEGYEVRLDPNEHQRYLWVGEEEATGKKCVDGDSGEVVEIEYTTKKQEELIYEAFRVWKGKQGQ